jgi:hypothetical protein
MAADLTGEDRMNSRTIDDRLAFYRKELHDALREVSQNIARRGGKMVPRCARLAWHGLRGPDIPPCDDISKWENGHFLRRVHDFYGWKAKDTVAKLGLCSGALYRSARYLEIDPQDRCGSRKQQNVHIEHTVPVNVLMKALRYCISSFDSPATLHDFLVGHSICTAVRFYEKCLLSEAGVDSKGNPAFDDDGRPTRVPPFVRYEKLASSDKNFRLFNVVSGEEIDIEKFTFADHVEALEAASRMVMPDASGIGIYSLERFELT